MAKVYYIMKDNGNGEATCHTKTRNKDYFEHEFNRLTNIPNTKELVKGQWIKHEITGVEFWKEEEEA